MQDKEQILEIKLRPYIYEQQIHVLILIEDFTPFNQITVLQQINENKSKMLYQVAHEFRTPLNCIILLVEHLYEVLDMNSDVVQSYLKPIEMSAT